MAQVRKMMVMIFINIFLLLLVTVLYEYVNLSERFTQLENNVSVALTQAVNSSVAAEELFSDQKVDQTFSYGSNRNKREVEANTLVWGGGSFYATNPFYLAMYYEENGSSFPTNSNLNSTFSSCIKSKQLGYLDGTEVVYEYLYGKLGTDYNNPSLEWANKSKSVKADMLTESGKGYTDRTPTSKFKQFYDNIGCKITTSAPVKKKTSLNGFQIAYEDVPVLANMGLKLTPYNNVSSGSMMDNFIMSLHVGKKVTGGMVQRSKYYLTPYSLGVTYVPIEVAKPLFIANLDTVVRLQKVAAGNPASVAEFESVAGSATGCLTTSVYEGSTRAVHTGGGWIVNDGSVEYDLSSVRMKVDYFYVDYYSSSANVKEVVSRLEGCVSAYSGGYSSLSAVYNKTWQEQKDKDTGKTLVGGHVNGKRLVARVTVRMKVHVCYESSVMQWLCRRFTGGATEHYDVKLYDSVTGYTNADDGVWFEYSTYFVQTR